MKTADWYIPHTYRVARFGHGWVVQEYNGAGQLVRTTDKFDGMEDAQAHADELKLNRAKHFGALIEG